MRDLILFALLAVHPITIIMRNCILNYRNLAPYILSAKDSDSWATSKLSLAISKEQDQCVGYKLS